MEGGKGTTSCNCPNEKLFPHSFDGKIFSPKLLQMILPREDVLGKWTKATCALFRHAPQDLGCWLPKTQSQEGGPQCGSQGQTWRLNVAS